MLSKPSVLVLPPNITLGSGCCGKVVPDGSAGPGIRLIGSAEPSMSASTSEAALVGCDNSGSRVAALKRFYAQCQPQQTTVTYDAGTANGTYDFPIVFAFDGH